LLFGLRLGLPFGRSAIVTATFPLPVCLASGVLKLHSIYNGSADDGEQKFDSVRHLPQAAAC
jgi:hypothetical protein